MPCRTRWMTRAWQNKLAAGFTVSASWGGDKQGTLHQLLTLAAQHGMVWVGLGMAPGNNHSKGSPEDLNRTGASLGLMAVTTWQLGLASLVDPLTAVTLFFVAWTVIHSVSVWA